MMNNKNSNKRFVKQNIPINNPLAKRYTQLGCSCNAVDVKPSLRINTLKAEEEEIIKRLKDKGASLEKIGFTKNGYYYDAKFSLGATPEYLQGYYYLQEAASQLPAQVLDSKPGESVLDICAAPGSKTTQIAAMMQNTGVIIALDDDSRRLLALRNNLARCGVTNCILYKKDARFATDFKLKFERILLDAPCSGNYAIERDFFIKKSLEGIRERSRVQKELLRSAVACLKNGGTLVYSTCSLEPEEDELNIEWLLGKYADLKLEDTGLLIGDPGLIDVFGQKLNPQIAKCRRFWPERTGTEGFFIAKIVKV